MTRPTLQHYLDAHPHDLRAAVDAYRADLHAWEFARTIEGSRPRPPWRAAAVGFGLLVVALLLMRALGGCSGPAPGDCALDCHDAHAPGSRALLDCVSACSSLGAHHTDDQGDTRP